MPPDEPLDAPPPRPWRPALAFGVLVLALHAALLGWLPLGVGAGWQGDVTRPQLAVRMLPPAPAPAAPEPVPPPPAPAVLQALAQPVAAAPPPAASAPPPTPDPEPAVVAAAEPASAAASAPAAEAPPAPAEGGGTTPPVYATRLPPAAELHYEMRRGALVGSAGFAWRPSPERYEMNLEGSAMSITLLQMKSEGGFDGAGLAPERFTDRRIRRSPQAANFQREAGKITFSGPPTEYPLLAGAQDRLSWMVQLPAIVAADPARWSRPGASIALFVVGARGDGDVWAFEVDGRESLDLPAGRVEGALRLHRLPRRPYDTQAEVWLDPARHWLPVRVRLAVAQADDAVEFRLQP